jgi:tetratricopeptide (TPR) repeat protein
MNEKPTCFVVMGFREKTDPISGKTFDLDKSYRILIKPAVEAAGATCVRADEIVHAEVIDVPMYEQLLQADLVVADLSTLNPNAFFELGVRYALRPRATVVIAEREWKNPFDTNHIATRRYWHMGEGIHIGEAQRFTAELTEVCKAVLDNDDVDSPVYTFIRDLQPPGVGGAIQLTAAAAAQRAAPDGSADDPMAKPLAELTDLATSHRRNENFAAMRQVLAGVVATMGKNPDPFAVQQLALATYKSKEPDARSALIAAREHLRHLDPDVTNDPETLGLWGAVHKRLWDTDQDRSYLDAAIGAYERGFYLKQDYYNGINLAFLLNVRAVLHRQRGDNSEAIADFVVARRVRREVIRYCERALTIAGDPAARYWVIATLWEAAVGLGDLDTAARWQTEAEAVAPAPWMLDSTRGQLDRLGHLLAESFSATV